MCVQKPFCIDFYVSFSLFARNLSKDERGSFWARNAKKLQPTELVTVRRAYDGLYFVIVVKLLKEEGKSNHVWGYEVHDGPS